MSLFVTLKMFFNSSIIDFEQVNVSWVMANSAYSVKNENIQPLKKYDWHEKFQAEKYQFDGKKKSK